MSLELMNAMASYTSCLQYVQLHMLPGLCPCSSSRVAVTSSHACESRHILRRAGNWLRIRGCLSVGIRDGFPRLLDPRLQQTLSRPFNVVCMAEPYLISKLESAERTYKELSVRLADPEVSSNPSEYQKLAKSMSDLEEVVATFQSFNACQEQLEEAKGDS